jgi:hypothetical protein
LRTFWVVLRVELESGIQVDDAQRQGVPDVAVGYYQKFGITAASSDAAFQLAVGQLSPSGVTNWDESTVAPIDVERLDLTIAKRSSDWGKEGLWYRSGRIFFTPD